MNFAIFTVVLDSSPYKASPYLYESSGKRSREEGRIVLYNIYLFSWSEQFTSAESSDTTAPKGGRDGRRSGEDEDFDFFLDDVLETEDDLFPFLAGLDAAWASSSAVGRGGTGR